MSSSSLIRPIRIVIFSRTFAPAIGGLENMAVGLARELSLLGCNVSVVTDVQCPAEMDVGLGYRVIRTSQAVVRWRAFRSADVVLMMNISLHGVFSTLATGVPVVASHQSCYFVKGAKNALEKIKRACMHFMTNVSCSRYTASQFNALSLVIPNAIGTAFDGVRPVASSVQRDFVFCGRLVSDKGVDISMSALALVLKDYPDASLTIVGDGPERENLEGLSNKLGIADSTRFVGAMRGSALVDELQRHLCLLVPSVWEEPFGIVALEGVACCRTMIVANRGGLPEAAGPCGVIVEPVAAAFAEAMRDVCAQRETDSLPGEPTRVERNKHLARHSMPRIASKYLGVLSDAAKSRSR